MAQLKVPVTQHDHIQGVENAPITLVEYGDYQCPHCRMAHYVVQKLQDHYAEKLRFVFRNFPLVQIHPYAESAAETAEFAGEHDLYWEMHDALYEKQDRLSAPLLVDLTESLGLSVQELQEALATHLYLPRVREDFVGGVRSGVNGTPSFFINGVRHDGSFAFEDLVSAIDAHLVWARPAA